MATITLRARLEQFCGDLQTLTAGVLILLAGLLWALTSVVARWAALDQGSVNLCWQLLQAPLLFALVMGFRLRRPELSEEDRSRVFVLLVLSMVGALLVSGALWLTEIEPLRPSVEEQLAGGLVGGTPAWVLHLGAILMAPFVEELFFRGVLLRGALLGGCSLPTAMAFQALIFALGHGDLALLPHFMVAGLGLGLFSLTRWGLCGAMLVHALFNAQSHLQAIL